DARHWPSLRPDVGGRRGRLAGRRLRGEGVLIIIAQRHGTQERNRQEARERLIDLIRRAATPPKPRHATRPTAASRRQRLESKTRRSRPKRLPAAKPTED